MPGQDTGTDSGDSGVRYYPNAGIYQGVRLHVGHGGWGSPENKAVTERIAADREWWDEHLSQWGPDPVSGKVKVYLVDYSEAAARVLADRYGDAIVMATESRPRMVGQGAPQALRPAPWT
jgi:hypothetical protein